MNVLCELVQKNPKDYLALAPQLFHLMTTSSNNWMLIKIIKLVGVLPSTVCPLLPYLNCGSVRGPLAVRTTAGEEASTSDHRPHLDHTGYLIAV